ncbi:MAG: XRE family transcriptional regulator [Oscillospiraceae bacterium]
MEIRIVEVAERIRTLREIMNFTMEEMAEAVNYTVERYEAAERGEIDFSINFLYKCADKFGVDMVEILTGEKPHLSFYTITRNGNGLPMERRSGFSYFHLGARLKDKRCEPFIVTAPYVEEEQNQPIHLSSHEGQEFDFILSGKMKIALENHIEILSKGDSVFFDSAHPHGMIAVDGEDCTFIAIVLKK